MKPVLINTTATTMLQSGWVIQKINRTDGITKWRVLISGLVLFILFIGTGVLSQNKKFVYKIIQGGDEVGFLTLTKKDSGLTTFLQMESEAKKRILFLITIYEKQSVVIEKGQVKYSCVFRKVNGSVKTNKCIHSTCCGYELCKDGEKEKIKLSSIQHNQLSLYYDEPVKYKQIYSDQFETTLTIETIKPNHYKIDLPDGNTNYYTYQNGVLTSLKLKHFFFSAEFILTKTE